MLQYFLNIYNNVYAYDLVDYLDTPVAQIVYISI